MPKELAAHFEIVKKVQKGVRPLYEVTGGLLESKDGLVRVGQNSHPQPGWCIRTTALVETGTGKIEETDKAHQKRTKRNLSRRESNSGLMRSVE
jgi:hypothetical protein